MNSDNNREKSSKKLSEDLELLRLRQASNNQQQIQDKVKRDKPENNLEGDKNNSSSKDKEELSPKLKTPSGLGMGGKEPERFVGPRLKKPFERGLPLPKPSYYLDAAEGQIPNAGPMGKKFTPAGYADFGRIGIDLWKMKNEKSHPEQNLSSTKSSEMNQEEIQNSANPINQKSNDLNKSEPVKNEPAKDPSKMSLDERIAYKAAKSNRTEQSKTAEQSKTNNKNLSR